MPAIQFSTVGEEFIHEHLNQQDAAIKKSVTELAARYDSHEQKLVAIFKAVQEIKEKMDLEKVSREAESRHTRELLEAYQADRSHRAAEAGETSLPPLKIIEPKKSEKPRADIGRRGTLAATSPYYLPAGSLVPVRLLTGVDAYPATGGLETALPVVILVTDNVTSPGSYLLPMKGCAILGRADGDLSSERVRINTHLISCVFPAKGGAGRTLDRELKGWITGPDGGLGIPGKVLDKRGRKLGLSFIAGFAAGINQAMASQDITRVISADGTERQILTGDAVSFGMKSALGQALGEVATFLKQEAARLLPVVSILSGVDGTLVVESGIDIPEIVSLFDEEGIQ